MATRCRGKPVRRGRCSARRGLELLCRVRSRLRLWVLGLAGAEFDRLKLAKACQRAEHEYAGAKCGIMDQFTACFGREGHAVFLDCRSLQFDLLPLPRDARIVICNSLVKHELANSEYNQRRVQCETAVQSLRARLPGISALRDVLLEELDQCIA